MDGLSGSAVDVLVVWLDGSVVVGGGIRCV